MGKRASTIRRIHITGNSGSGKTVLGAHISQLTGIPHHNLDDLYWKKKFDIARPKHVRIRLLERLTRRRSWITEGAGTSWTAHAMRRADLIIELRKPRPLLLWRVLRRSVHRRLQPGEPKESPLNLWRLCKYIWAYQDPNKRHRQQRDALLLEANGEHVVVKSEKDIKRLIGRLQTRR